jgi:nucleotidyltransferase/DNA polymerase involved in DNA repair
MLHKKIYAVVHLPNFAAQIIATYFRDFQGCAFVVTEQAFGRHKTMVFDCSLEAQALGIYPEMAVHEIDPDLHKKISFVPRNVQIESNAQVDILRSLQDLTPAVSQLGDNEFLLDITATPILRSQDIATAGGKIQKLLQKQPGVQYIAVGIGQTKICAQVLARSAVPDKVELGFESENTAFLSLEVSLLPGLLPADQEKLEKLGIIRIGQLQNMGRGIIRRIFGNRGECLLAAAKGMDLQVKNQKNIVIVEEEVLETDINVLDVLHKIFLKVTDRVFHQVQQHKARTSTLVLTITYGDGQKSETRIHLRRAAQHIENIEILKSKFNETYIRRVAVRSIGVRATKIQPDHGQMSLFGRDSHKSQNRNQAILNIRQRFGFDAIKSATYFGLKK